MNDSDLDRILRSAGNEMPLPSSFKRTVWQRIESSSAGFPGFRIWLETVLHPLANPVVATATIFGMAVIGLGLGATSAGSDSESLKTAYVQSVSPFRGGHE